MIYAERREKFLPCWRHGDGIHGIRLFVHKQNSVGTADEPWIGSIADTKLPQDQPTSLHGLNLTDVPTGDMLRVEAAVMNNNGEGPLANYNSTDFYIEVVDHAGAKFAVTAPTGLALRSTADTTYFSATLGAGLSGKYYFRHPVDSTLRYWSLSALYMGFDKLPDRFGCSLGLGLKVEGVPGFHIGLGAAGKRHEKPIWFLELTPAFDVLPFK